MAASVFDNALVQGLFATGEVSRLFSASAELRALLLVEGALATVQGAAGIIPAESAAAINRATLEVQIDPTALSRETALNGVSVPALVAAFRAEMQAPEHAQYLHWGATSQDILDSALMLRLRQVVSLLEADCLKLLQTLADLAEAFADTPMAGRTFNQQAAPTSFGAVVASWGAPLLPLCREVGELRANALYVSLSGAVGTGTALGPDPQALRAALASTLKLADPERPWHTDRTPVLRIAGWASRLSLALAKIGEDVIAFAQTETGELALTSAGHSSTMPQKQNPVAASALVALGRQAAGLNGILQGASVHRFQRDASAWFTEWMTLPQIMLGAASSLQNAGKVVAGLDPQPARMATNLSDRLGLIHAEALSFALAPVLGRPDAQAAVKSLCQQVLEEQTPLGSLAISTWPQLDLTRVFDPARQLGTAPADARRFAHAARAVGPAA